MPGHMWKLRLVQTLTLARVPLMFLFLAISVLAAGPPATGWFCVALGAMILSAATDLVDGWLARWFNVTSRFGAHLDPLTDKIFYLTALPTLVYLAAVTGQGRHAALLLVLTVLFLLRDQWVSFLRSIGAMHGVDVKANWSGKVRTLISFPAVCVIYYFLAAPADWRAVMPAAIVYTAEAACMTVNVISIWVYTRYYWPWLKKEIDTVGDDT